jgi:hypothetical protein
MNQTAIFPPFFATMLLTLAVWLYMYVRRIAFITGNELTPGELAVPGRLAELSPPHVSNPSDDLKNLFEIPVLFYALVLYAPRDPWRRQPGAYDASVSGPPAMPSASARRRTAASSR